MVTELERHNLVPESCPKCDSRTAYYDFEFGFYECRDCFFVWDKSRINDWGRQYSSTRQPLDRYWFNYLRFLQVNYCSGEGTINLKEVNSVEERAKYWNAKGFAEAFTLPEFDWNQYHSCDISGRRGNWDEKAFYYLYRRSCEEE